MMRCCLIVLVAALVSPAWASAQDPTETATPTGKVLNLAPGWGILFIAGVVAALAGLWFTLLWRDRDAANARLDKHDEALIAALTADGARLTPAEFKTAARAIRLAPIGTRGLTRSTLALGLLSLVAVAVTALLVGDSGQAGDLLKTVVTSLTAALATVVGFYFGSKSTSDAVDTAGGAAGTPAAPGPVLTPGAPAKPNAAPKDGAAEVSFEPPAVTGTSAITGYLVTSQPDEKTAESVTSPVTVTGLKDGTSYFFVVQARNDSGLGPKSPPSDAVYLKP